MPSLKNTFFCIQDLGKPKVFVWFYLVWLDQTNKKRWLGLTRQKISLASLGSASVRGLLLSTYVLFSNSLNAINWDEYRGKMFRNGWESNTRLSFLLWSLVFDVNLYKGRESLLGSLTRRLAKWRPLAPRFRFWRRYSMSPNFGINLLITLDLSIQAKQELLPKNFLISIRGRESG